MIFTTIMMKLREIESDLNTAPQIKEIITIKIFRKKPTATTDKIRYFRSTDSF
jgi:hypothetical protein